MTIHYHGLPLTPEILLNDLGGRHVCISFATRRDGQVEKSLRLMQSIMFDNGAFSAFRSGVPFDVAGYYQWVSPLLRHPHWAVVPDVIDGSVDDQRALINGWPFSRAMGAPVWHLALPTDFLVELARDWPRVCFGSSGSFWQIGSPAWRRRMQEAFEALAAASLTPWVHGLRMMSQAGKWPLLASVDSVNIARNFKDGDDMPSRMADRIDRVNAPPLTIIRTQSDDLFDIRRSA